MAGSFQNLMGFLGIVAKLIALVKTCWVWAISGCAGDLNGEFIAIPIFSVRISPLPMFGVYVINEIYFTIALRRV